MKDKLYEQLLDFLVEFRESECPEECDGCSFRGNCGTIVDLCIRLDEDINKRDAETLAECERASINLEGV